MGTQISIKELLEYYKSYNGNRETDWKQKLGDDLNWDLSIQQYKEAETTKHVHRLQPYKGKLIPQLVEYFIDDQCYKLITYFATSHTGFGNFAIMLSLIKN